MSAVCNNDCICIDGDCSYFHPIPKQDRKIVRKLYDSLQNPDKTEPNSSTRKANCRNGRLCYSKNCGFRHRLAFPFRMKLNEGLSAHKLDAAKTKKEPEKLVVKGFEIATANLFVSLDVEEEVSQVVPEVVPAKVPEMFLAKKFADVVALGPVVIPKVIPVKAPEVVVKVPVVYDRWEDIPDDEDFLMKF